MNLAIILTIRTGSSRLPRKALMEIQGKSVATWIIERLKVLPGKVIIATTTEPGDDAIASVGKMNDVPVFRGPVDDVVTRVEQAVQAHYPQADFVFRALGDCPFIETNFVLRAARIMEKFRTEAFVFFLPPDVWSCYGSREFPLSRNGWNKIVANARGDQREHTDAFFHCNRKLFNITYHEPPPTTYFRNYRLEIDWIEDFNLVKRIFDEIGPNPSLSDVIHHMDAHPELTRINREHVEKTGPLTSYDYAMRRGWMKMMLGKPVISWDDTIWEPPDPHATPVFCNTGKCLIGHGTKEGVLYKRNGDRIVGDAYLSCACGAGKYWKLAKERVR